MSDFDLDLLLPDHREAHRLLGAGKCLTHYTKAANDILANNFIWLQNAAQMKDREEIRFGRAVVDEWMGTSNKRLKAALNEVHSSLYRQLLQCWLDEKHAQENGSYIACFTVGDANDLLGNPHHWQNYRNTALFFSPNFMAYEKSQLALYLIRVVYGKSAILAKLETLVLGLEQNVSVLRKYESSRLASILRHALFFVATASKKIEFAPENEWRLIYSPFLFSSAYIWEQTTTTDGRDVYLFRFECPDHLANPFAATNQLIARILVKDNDVFERRLKLIAQLTYLGVSNARDRVFVVNSEQ